ncbi:hypothetical protein RND81_06G135100 [Saponaria officinalis]|uniref:Senescence regulator n=1 Tax=Saponaria officinalis TaxID=3572 RepID=A0AAW1K9N4_SAPOF
MAKGRRLTTSRSERLLRNNYGHVPVTYNGDVSEFAEEDVWSIIEHVPDYHHQNDYAGGDEYSGAYTPRAAVDGGRRQGVGGLSLAFEDQTASPRRIVHQFGNNNNINNGGGGPRVGRHVATSAPVNVPDWSKILRVDSAESMHDSYEDDPDGGDSGMEPPHEYLARSRKMNAFSVYEGVGRTLKGRDMSRVRDAVWSQTGFEG